MNLTLLIVLSLVNSENKRILVITTGYKFLNEPLIIFDSFLVHTATKLST